MVDMEESVNEDISMYSDPHDYMAYLLRLWRPNHGSENSTASGWYASLEPVDTGQRVGFGSLDELFAFLANEVKQYEKPQSGERDDR
jgi:hypothetical protein